MPSPHPAADDIVPGFPPLVAKNMQLSARMPGGTDESAAAAGARRAGSLKTAKAA